MSEQTLDRVVSVEQRTVELAGPQGQVYLVQRSQQVSVELAGELVPQPLAEARPCSLRRAVQRAAEAAAESTEATPHKRLPQADQPLTLLPQAVRLAQPPQQPAAMAHRLALYFGGLLAAVVVAQTRPIRLTLEMVGMVDHRAAVVVVVALH